jgi:hypothetical protein
MATNRSLIRLQHWYRLLLAERTRRRDSNGYGDAIREQLLAKLMEMGERMRADPNFVEPDPVESRKAMNVWFRERGYSARLK